MWLDPRDEPEDDEIGLGAFVRQRKRHRRRAPDCRDARPSAEAGNRSFVMLWLVQSICPRLISLRWLDPRDEPEDDEIGRGSVCQKAKTPPRGMAFRSCCDCDLQARIRPVRRRRGSACISCPSRRGRPRCGRPCPRWTGLPDGDRRGRRRSFPRHCPRPGRSRRPDRHDAR
jgi:hypothetical protein